MIPQGWMAPICIVPATAWCSRRQALRRSRAMRITELWEEAGLPAGVLNIVTTSRNEAEILLRHPAIKGVTFVGSTERRRAHLCDRGRQRQARAGAHRSQEPRAGASATAVIERTAQGIINSFCGCAGERCMALPGRRGRKRRSPTEFVEPFPRLPRHQAGPGLRQGDRPGSGGQPRPQGIRSRLDRDRNQGRRQADSRRA